MAQFHVPGPARIFVGTGDAGALEALGFSVDGVTISLQPRFDDIFTDLGGPAVPEDIQFLGVDAMVRFALSKYNEAQLQELSSFLLGGTDGAWSSYDIGTLLGHEGKAFRLLIVAPYQSAKSAYYSAQQGAYNFPLTYPIEVEMPVSTRVKMPRVSFRAWPQFDSDCLGGATLFDADTTGVPNIC